MKKRSPSINSAVKIKFLSPSIILSVSIFLFFVTLTVLPVTVKIPLTNEALIFWFVCFFSFLGGALLGSGNKCYIQLKADDIGSTLQFKKKTMLDIVNFIAAAGFLGSILLLVDRYGLRGVSFAANALENREVLVDNESSIISTVAAFLSSIGVFAYMLIWLAELKQVSIGLQTRVIAALNVLVVILVSVQLGSRSLLLVILLSYTFAWFFVLKFRDNKLKTTHILIAFALLACMAVVSALLIIMRVNLMGLSMTDSILISSYAEIIEPSEFILDLLQSDSIWNVFVAGLFSLVQYFFHGIYEFSLLFNNFSGEHEMGVRLFWLPFKVLSTLTDGSISVGEFNNSGIREGIFNTYTGPVFIDFGLFSPVILFLNGFLLGFPFRWLAQGKLAWLPAVTLVATGTILYPVVNIFESSSGTFLLIGSVVIGLVGKYFQVVSLNLDRTRT